MSRLSNAYYGFVARLSTVMLRRSMAPASKIVVPSRLLEILETWEVEKRYIDGEKQFVFFVSAFPDAYVVIRMPFAEAMHAYAQPGVVVLQPEQIMIPRRQMDPTYALSDYQFGPGGRPLQCSSLEQFRGKEVKKEMGIFTLSQLNDLTRQLEAARLYVAPTV